MWKNLTAALAAVLALVFLAGAGSQVVRRGRIFDATTGKPIDKAIVTLGDSTAHTDPNGRFEIRAKGLRLGARAYGYSRGWADLAERPGAAQDFALRGFAPKALYLSVYGIGDRRLRESALELIETTELNALVVDIKGDRGMIPYRSGVPLAAQVGAQQVITVRDIGDLVKSLHDKGVYAIARIVVFKDNPLASARPDLAVKDLSGALWHDREGLAWTDPFKKQVWEYNIALAVEAAQYGFDEIQFDYVRFPDARGLAFSMANTEASRVKAVSEFLETARKKLTPYNVFLAADIFGYVCWNLDDTGIGQTLEASAAHVDYLSPMLYPSGFHLGIPGCRAPVAHPYDVVYRSLARAGERTGLPPVRFRPWLQAFRDYAFDRRPFATKEITQQIRAAEEFGANGWMLWNPQNIYSVDGLRGNGN
jgi:hypothetical protein